MGERNDMSKNSRYIDSRELYALIPYTPQHILRLEKKGMFPLRIKMGPNKVVWLRSEIEQWLEERQQARFKSVF